MGSNYQLPFDKVQTEKMRTEAIKKTMMYRGDQLSVNF